MKILRKRTTNCLLFLFLQQKWFISPKLNPFRMSFTFNLVISATTYNKYTWHCIKCIFDLFWQNSEFNIELRPEGMKSNNAILKLRIKNFLNWALNIDSSHFRSSLVYFYPKCEIFFQKISKNLFEKISLYWKLTYSVLRQRQKWIEIRFYRSLLRD